MKIKRVLVPIDLSENSLSAIPLALRLAEIHGAKMVYLFVAPKWMTEGQVINTEYVKDYIRTTQAAFDQVQPENPTIESESHYLFGNPGPEIVRMATPEDVIAMCTHGHTGFKRFLVGSVAQYVMRYAPCPVITLKATVIIEGTSDSTIPPSALQTDQPTESPARLIKQRFVTDLMYHVLPLETSESMHEAIGELEAARQTAAPVVDRGGICQGILTATDIRRFRDSEASTEVEADAMVQHWFSSPVITLSHHSTCHEAHEILSRNPDIHHLVVVNDEHQPLGVIDSDDIYTCQAEDGVPADLLSIRSLDSIEEE